LRAILTGAADHQESSTDEGGARHDGDSEGAGARHNSEHPRREVVLRRTWPQRLIVLACLLVIAGALGTAYQVDRTHGELRRLQRIPFSASSESSGGLGEAAGEAAAADPENSGDFGGASSGPGMARSAAGLLRPDTAPGDPVNFLLVGTDSALGLDPDDPVLHGRYVDPTGRSGADSIMIVRLDPVSGSAWVLSIPRDLWAEIPGAQDNRITSAMYIGGAPLLVRTITSMFDVEINHYVELDFAGFRSLVDILGGVPVWFPNPVRDPGSGLNIAASGCHVLNGEQALQYVRARRYTEHIDGRWQITGGDDLTRIERQQDFLVLALDRAIDRGARNLFTMSGMIEAGADIVKLDDELTLSELIDLGEAFSGFNPENLYRQRLEVYGLFWPDGTYKGEAAVGGSNEAILEVLRGKADGVRPGDVPLRLIGSDLADLADAALVLEGQGFVVAGSATASEPIPATVLVHGPDHAADAMTVARYLDPVPYVVASDDVEGVVAALGNDYNGVLFLYQPSPTDVLRMVTERGVPAVVPSLKTVFEESAATPRESDTSDEASSGADLQGSTSPGTAPPLTQAPAEITGRPPEGRSCG